MNPIYAFFDRLADRIERTPWWLPNVGYVAFAAAMWATSLALVPGGDRVYWGHTDVGGTCAFLASTGKPCPQCGMTRAFLWAARLHLHRSFDYNPAGLALFWWITAGGAVGAWRLWKRDPRAATVPWRLLSAWALLWFVGLWGGAWVLRLAGIHPIP